jgi:hypothetical protein
VLTLTSESPGLLVNNYIYASMSPIDKVFQIFNKMIPGYDTNQESERAMPTCAMISYDESLSVVMFLSQHHESYTAQCTTCLQCVFDCYAAFFNLKLVRNTTCMAA